MFFWIDLCRGLRKENRNKGNHEKSERIVISQVFSVVLFIPS